MYIYMSILYITYRPKHQTLKWKKQKIFVQQRSTRAFICVFYDITNHSSSLQKYTVSHLRKWSFPFLVKNIPCKNTTICNRRNLFPSKIIHQQSHHRNRSSTKTDRPKLSSIPSFVSNPEFSLVTNILFPQYHRCRGSIAQANNERQTRT